MDEVIIKWQIEDVKALQPDFTDEQCREVLARFEKHHEGSMESMQQDLQLHADELVREEHQHAYILAEYMTLESLENELEDEEIDSKVKRVIELAGQLLEDA